MGFAKPIEQYLFGNLLTKMHVFMYLKDIIRGADQMLGGGPYEATTCPECGSTMWNGRCENPDCKYHWHPEEEEDAE